MKTRLSVAVISLCLCAVNAVAADHNAYVYCIGNDPGSYFSDVFRGDLELSEKYQKSFASFLSTKYGVDTNVNVGCVFYLNEQIAINAKNRYVRATIDHGGGVVETNWSYKQ